jgi:hypothetical protein
VVERVTRAASRAAPFDATITGHVRDPAGAPIAGAVVRAAPSIRAPVAFVLATTGPDGAFQLAGADVPRNTQLGLEGAFASLRGLPGTPVAVTLRRGEQIVQLTLERRMLRS